jgi:hypothetical protein
MRLKLGGGMQMIANLAIVLGSVGMIYFALKFPFSTYPGDLKYDRTHKFLGIVNGYHFWFVSWFLLLAGALLQLILPWLPLMLSWLSLPATQ